MNHDLRNEIIARTALAGFMCAVVALLLHLAHG